MIKACLGPKQRPVNPHAQRLLTAEARGATKVPKQPSKAEKAEKKRKTDKQKEVESGVSRTAYFLAKKDFMAQDWFLVSKRGIQVEITM